MASYDYEGARAYVLEAGDYVVSINSDSHNVISEQTVSVPETITYDTEDNTHNGDLQVATNVFDEANGGLTYLSRAERLRQLRRGHGRTDRLLDVRRVQGDVLQQRQLRPHAVRRRG